MQPPHYPVAAGILQQLARLSEQELDQLHAEVEEAELVAANLKAVERVAWLAAMKPEPVQVLAAPPVEVVAPTVEVVVPASNGHMEVEHTKEPVSKPTGGQGRKQREVGDANRLRVAKLLLERGPMKVSGAAVLAELSIHAIYDWLRDKHLWFEKSNGELCLTTAGHQAATGNLEKEDEEGC